jgi:hypothetical protein
VEIAGDDTGHHLLSVLERVKRRDPLRKLSPALFATIVLCFFLPFVTVTCGGAVTVTGVQAAMGLDRPAGLEGESAPHLLALIALVATFAGLGFGLVRRRGGALGGAMTGAVGVITLSWFLVDVGGKTSGRVILRRGGGDVHQLCHLRWGHTWRGAALPPRDFGRSAESGI